MFSDCETVDIISWYFTFYATEVLVEFYVFLCTLHKQRSNSSFAQLFRKKINNCPLLIDLMKLFPFYLRKLQK